MIWSAPEYKLKSLQPLWRKPVKEEPRSIDSIFREYGIDIYRAPQPWGGIKNDKTLRSAFFEAIVIHGKEKVFDVVAANIKLCEKRRFKFLDEFNTNRMLEFKKTDETSAAFSRQVSISAQKIIEEVYRKKFKDDQIQLPRL